MTKDLKITWLEPDDQNCMRVTDMNHVRKKTCLVCDSKSTSVTSTWEACQEIFKIQKGPLNCDSQKVTLKMQSPW